ncbi:hypothetical protein [Nitrosomonas sp.]|uniref:hypothetical protein n=1 Tax=Nitrosomonas sp. TaxID=42353 RepID=UPI00208D7DA5|nr:hypothetical protein [Nitrosomonas sp.]GJL75955.1 MAG: hypothetical protein NMNS02_20610 [Nitrosomonas sp.]
MTAPCKINKVPGFIELLDRRNPENGRVPLNYYFSPELGNIAELIMTGQAKVNDEDDNGYDENSHQQQNKLDL